VAERGRPLFSIGAVARMVELAPATIRTWETRYGLVTPERSGGGQRLYSRDQVEQLRFVKAQIGEGRRPGEAHRLLQERIARGDGVAGTRMRVLLAESGLSAGRVLRELLGEDGFEGLVSGGDGQTTALVVIDPGDVDVEELSDRLRASGATIVPVDRG
jgi:DNA-binding transcriptional MerR regulator